MRATYVSIALACLLTSGCVCDYPFDPANPPEEIQASIPTKAPRGEDVDPFISTWLSIDLEGVTPEEAFDAFLGLPVKDYFTGTEAFPAVAKVEVLTPAWKEAGSRRRITLVDGNTAFEQIFAADRPRYFSFSIWNFTGSSGLVIGFVLGEWWFTKTETGVHLLWRFSFRPRAWPSSWILEDVVKEDYRAYMKQIAAQFERTVEAAAAVKTRPR